MSATQKLASPALGLDIGTSRIVLARLNGDQPVFRSQLNAFVTIPYSPMTERALVREAVPYTRKDSTILVHGDESERFADLLGVEIRRPLTAGLLNPAEAESTDVILRIVDSLLGADSARGARLVFSVPAPSLSSDDNNLTYHEATLRELLAERGYNAGSLNEGLAVVYAEMESTNYSGIGISFGGGLCNVCLAHLAHPVVSFSLAKAGDYIDASAAAVSGETVTRVRLEKETSFRFNGAFPSKLHQALGVYYDAMIQALIEAMREAFGSSDARKFRKPVPVVLSGGTALPEGFAARFAEALSSAGLPIPISEIRLAPNPLHSTAKGTLMAALAEA